MRWCRASGEMSTGMGNCAALATNCPTEVLRVLHAPSVTNARNTLPVILEVRRTNPVRRAHASIWAVAKNSVTFSTMPSHGSAIAVSFASPADDNPMPSYYELETATSPRILHTYPVSFMPMGLEALRKPFCGSSITKFTLGRWSKFAEHQVNVAELDHRGGGFRFALVVFAIAPGPAVPRLRALHDPAFAHRREPCGSLWPGLHLDSPARTIL